MKSVINYFKVLFTVTFIFSLVFLFIACNNPTSSKGAANGESPLAQLFSMEISDAAVLFVADTNGVSGSSFGPLSNSRGLYKRNENGHVERVRGRTSADEEINVPAPTRIVTVDDRYLIMVFDGAAFLVSKVNGRVYSMASVGVPANNQIFGGRDVFTDSPGNIYFMTGGSVFKVDVSNPENISATLYSPSVDSVKNFVVDDAGNLFYTRTTHSSGARLRFADTGGIYQFTEATGGTNPRPVYWHGWKGYDGVLYTGSRLQSLGGHSYRTTVTSTYDVNREAFGVGFDWRNNNWEWHHLNDRLVVRIGYQFYVAYLEAGDFNSVNEHQPLGSVTIEQSTGIGSSLFVLTDAHSLFGISLLTMESVDIFLNSEGAYEFYSIAALSDTEIQFRAFHLGTATVVSGIIDATNGQMTIADQESAYSSEIYALIEL